MILCVSATKSFYQTATLAKPAFAATTSTVATQGSVASSAFKEKDNSHDFGTVPQGTPVSYVFNFTNTGNSEIADQWFLMAIKANYEFAYPQMESFLSSVGRRKFIEPLYIEMMKTAKGRDMAKDLYTKYRKNYHPLAQESLDKLILKKY